MAIFTIKSLMLSLEEPPELEMPFTPGQPELVRNTELHFIEKEILSLSLAFPYPDNRQVFF